MIAAAITKESEMTTYQCQRADCRRTATYEVFVVVTTAAAPHGPQPGTYTRGDFCERHAVAQTSSSAVYMRPVPAYAETVR